LKEPQGTFLHRSRAVRYLHLLTVFVSEEALKNRLSPLFSRLGWEIWLSTGMLSSHLLTRGG